MAKRKHDTTRAAFRNVGAIYPIGGLGGSGLETVVEGCTGPMKALFDLHDPHPAEVRTSSRYLTFLGLLFGSRFDPFNDSRVARN